MALLEALLLRRKVYFGSMIKVRYLSARRGAHKVLPSPWQDPGTGQPAPQPHREGRERDKRESRAKTGQGRVLGCSPSVLLVCP